MPKKGKDNGTIAVLDSDGQPLGSVEVVEDSGIECDFSEIPRHWSKTMTRMYADTLKALVIMNSKQDDDASPEEQFNYIKEVAIAADDTANADGEFESLLAQVVISVNRRWLTNKAPHDLDWSDPDSFGWIRDILHLKFFSAVMEQRAELTKQAKN